MATLYRKDDVTGEFVEVESDTSTPDESAKSVFDVPFNEPTVEPDRPRLSKSEAKRPEDDRPALSKSEAKRPEPEEEHEPEFYVHLANGDVERVAESDLPGNAGHGATHGFWQKDGKVYRITGVHPTETEVKES